MLALHRHHHRPPVPPLPPLTPRHCRRPQVMLPELKAKELLHNEFYDSDQQAQTGVQV